MIREDRIKLNERFIKVFEQLQEKEAIILNDRNGKGMGDFAAKILGNRSYGHIVRAFLNKKDKRVIDYRQAKLVCQYYDINEHYLIDGIGTPFGKNIFRNNQHFEPSSSAQHNGNIMYTTIQAFAGSGESVADITTREEQQYFSIPGVAGSQLVAFHIEGDSMEPQIHDGDMLICRELQGINEIKNNEIYAIKQDGVLWVKHVQKMKHNGRLTHLKMLSANHLEYDPFTIELNDQTRLYKVIRQISCI